MAEDSVMVGETVRTYEPAKAWGQVTDDELVEAVRRCAERDRAGVARGSTHVLTMLSSPRPEQWATQPCPPNAVTGMGLIPRFDTSASSVTARLKRLVRAGRLIQVAMVHPRGKPAPPAYRVAEAAE